MRKIQQILQDLIHTFRWIKYPVIRARAERNYDQAVSLADQHLRTTGHRSYVVLSMSRKLIVMDRQNFRRLKQKKIISPKANLSTLINHAVYFTPYADGGSPMPKELQAYNRKEYIKAYIQYQLNKK